MHEADGSAGGASDPVDLVVAVEHTDEVVRMLRDFEVGDADVERSSALGLSLVRVPAADAAAARFSAEVAEQVGTRLAGSGHGEPTHLDRLLTGLRVGFAATYNGWAPTMGKNRLLGGVVGGGKISHGGALAPAASDRQLAVREARPGRGVRVGVLDTAIRAHPWLAGGWVAAPGDVRPDGDAPAAAGHATFVAGLVLQEAPGCVVAARQVLADDGSADSWSVAREIVAHGQDGLDVLNLSLFCHTEDGEAPLVLARAIDRLPSETVVVAAAGNYGKEGTLDGPDRPAWPAALDGVIAVGATDDAGKTAPFSPAGVPWVDALAPGVNRVSTYLDGTVTFDKGDPLRFEGLASWSGTSFAAASVSGAIAARTVPGRVSARRAWEMMREESERPAVVRLRS
ncbi:S8 family peptidase [Nocardioides sp. GXQ0305]|uniref:S8 family peptidase n=1 Tax=Nocardioides sp. GXQ0305 TaxID=3423912 RepID=UPI003D7C52B7